MARTAELALTGITKQYGGSRAVDDLSLTVPAGSYVVLLGPSGSGKTTLLSILGGFTAPTSGRVILAGEDITMMPPARRPTATVFQDYALFPHMTVAGNIGFGLSVRGVARPEIKRRVDEAMAIVDLAGFGSRRISAASGGQRQRIALARALVTDPAILLLDEPLGALDLHLRRQMQDELRQLQTREGRTFVHVTHDQEEAMAVADMIIIMNRGRIEDQGTPEGVYAKPRTRFSAQFMGDSTILPASFADGCAQTPVGRLPAKDRGGASVAIRPESLHLSGTAGSTPLGQMRVADRVFQGSFARLTGHVGPTEVLLRASPAEAPAPGDMVPVWLAAGGAVALTD